jgi:hypothetical protein
MTPATIIRAAESDGLSLSISPSGKLGYSGSPATVERWLPVLREHRAELLRLLAANEPADHGPKLDDLEEPGRSAGWRIFRALLSRNAGGAR